MISASAPQIRIGLLRMAALFYGAVILIVLIGAAPARSGGARRPSHRSIHRSLAQLRKGIPELRAASKTEYTQDSHIPFVSCDLGNGEAAVSLAVYGPFNDVSGVEAIAITSGQENVARAARSLATAIAATTGESDKQRVAKWVSQAIRSTTSSTQAPSRKGNEVGWGTGEAIVFEEQTTVLRGIRVKLRHSTEHAGNHRHMITVIMGSELR